MQKQRRNFVIEREELLDRSAKVTKRRNGLSEYVEVLNAELGRIARIKSSGQLFADLKVTQCPVCDQEVIPDESQDVCYLCTRPRPRNDADLGAAMKRVGFEEDQMREEAAELHELIGQLSEEEKTVELELEGIEATIRQLEGDLAPAQQLVEAMIPPDLSILDQEAGRIREQLMNSYLNAINAGGLQRWGHGRISFAFRERDFQVRVKGRRWIHRSARRHKRWFFLPTIMG